MKGARHKRSHTERFHLYEVSRIGNSIETESRFSLQGLGGGGDWRMTANGSQSGSLTGSQRPHRVSLQGDGNVLELDRGDGFTTL